MIGGKQLEEWVRDAVEKDYTKNEILVILKKNGFDSQEIDEALEIYEALKKKIQGTSAQIYDELEIPEEQKIPNKDFQDNKNHLSEEVNEVSDLLKKLRTEVRKVVFGQEDILDGIITSLLCNAHVLVEGVPGIAKTLLVKTIAKVSGCDSKRIQFTADLLPTDIIGITSYNPQKGFEVVKGPVFTNFLIADEINRSPPKTQSALLEAMQEKQVTIGREKFQLTAPFFVMANNNPIETSGVYTLPEAQIDRFLFKLIMSYPQKEDELKIMDTNATIKDFDDYDLNVILSPEKIIWMQEITKKVYLDDRIKRYIIRIVDKTRKRDLEKGKYIEWGASPRASIGMFIAAKAKALISGRNYVIPQDVQDVAFPVLRHRVLLNYRAQAEGITSDHVIKDILKITKID
ncbi:MoxR family ATPase [Candidatus Pacearchaeota archaeon]|nr:MoxR family ATPase [Candidatus Pacearchaeota archaeon]